MNTNNIEIVCEAIVDGNTENPIIGRNSFAPSTPIKEIVETFKSQVLQCLSVEPSEIMLNLRTTVSGK